MWIIGCDFHRIGQQVSAVNQEGGEVVEQWLQHGESEEVDKFYSSLPPGSEVGVETSGNMRWFERKLAQYGKGFHRRIKATHELPGLEQKQRQNQRQPLPNKGKARRKNRSARAHGRGVDRRVKIRS